MVIDYALILSAGYGKRMGEIGKFLPKPLWPIYEKTLLELAILRITNLNIKKIFINTHFQEQKINDFLKKKFPLIEVLHEVELLGNGGAIHNLASQKNISYKGRLLVINVDTFHFFNENFWKKITDSLFDITLVGAKIDCSSYHNNYKELSVKDNILKNIIENKNKNKLIYSGMSILNLESLDHISGYSNFFNTIANYKMKPINVIFPQRSEFWDFGSVMDYMNSLNKILEIKKIEECLMFDFLINCNAINRDKINWQKRSYGVNNGTNSFNFSNVDFRHHFEQSIILAAKKDQEIKSKKIIYGEIEESLLNK